ncbi:MAG: cytochrome c [Alphaproteobacteria bacterium]|nr:cytochrome c [Alphaproteobacteria bacterium]
MFRMLLPTVLIAIVAATSSAAAQNLEVIKSRKDTLGEMGKAAKQPGKMMKQEIPFDKAVVDAALDVIIAKAPTLHKMFPDDSKTGGKTEALPALWENKDDVIKRFEKLVADAKAAKAGINDEFDFMDNWPKVVGNCGGCHKKYREKKE